MRIARASLGALSIVAIGGCTDLSTDSSQVRYGVLSVTAEPATTGGGFVTNPIGLFYLDRAGALPDSKSQQDNCAGQAFSTAAPPPRQVQFIDAGATITFTTGGNTQQMNPVSGGTRYVLPQSVAFVPGALVSFQIPGAEGGFPASTVNTNTPPPITFQQVLPEPPAGSGLALSWNAGDDSSRVEVALRYAASPSTDANQQIYCQLRDDGTHSIPDDLLTGWRNANNDVREAAANRFRTHTNVDGDVALLVYSVSQTSIPLAPLP
ncbi:MAG: hypothetical protein ACREON_12745 [Gemmatimonadaceae bacterium]